MRSSKPLSTGILGMIFFLEIAAVKTARDSQMGRSYRIDEGFVIQGCSPGTTGQVLSRPSVVKLTARTFLSFCAGSEITTHRCESVLSSAKTNVSPGFMT